MKSIRGEQGNHFAYHFLLDEAGELAVYLCRDIWEPPTDEEWAEQIAERGLTPNDVPKPDYPENQIYRRNGSRYSHALWGLEDYINRSIEQGFDADINPDGHDCQILFQGAIKFPDTMVQALADKLAGHILSRDPLSTGKWMGEYLAAKLTDQLPRPKRGKRPARTSYEIFRMWQFIDEFKERGLPKKKTTHDTERYDLVDLLIEVWPTITDRERSPAKYTATRKFIIKHCIDNKPTRPMI